MLIGERSDHASALCALDETLHDEIRLVDFLNSTRVLANGGGNGAYAYWSATELVDDGEQNFVVNLVKSILVDVESR